MIAVVLAAGAGRRLGTVAKALLRSRPNGPTFLEIIADSCGAAGVTRLVVVVGPPFGAEVERAARGLRVDGAVDVVWNPSPERGMASSVAVGFTRASEVGATDRGALLWPVDHPLAGPALVRRMRAALGDACAVIPCFRGRGGHPVLVASRLWGELSDCTELEFGARSVLRAPGRQIIRIEASSAAPTFDVDVPADLRLLAGARL